MANAWVMLPKVMAAISASATAAGYDAANMGNDHAGVVWKSPGGASSVTIVVDLGVPQRIDTAMFFGCTDAGASWTMTVQNADNPSFTNATQLATGATFLAGSALPTHGRGVGYWTAATAGAPRRYWRFIIATPGNEPVTIARIAMGQRVTPERNFSFGGGWGVKDLGSTERSAQGVLIRRRAAKLRVLGISFGAMNKNEVESAVLPLVEMAGEQEPIVLCTDPAADAQRQRRCWIGTMTGDIGAIWRTARRWEWKANLLDLFGVPAGLVTPGVAFFDFGNGTMPTGVTLTRTTTGTRFNASGAMVSAAINEARFDYSPATLALRGVLIEEARTNLLLQSTSLTTTPWEVGSGTLSVTGGQPSPDGSNGVTIADTDTGAAANYRQTGVTLVSGTTYCWSVYVKKDAIGKATRVPMFRLLVTGGSIWIAIDTQTGEATYLSSSSVIPTVSSVDCGQHWRIVVSFVSPGTTFTFSIYPAYGSTSGALSGVSQNNSLTGSVTLSLPQIGAGTSETSFIPTTTSAVTRAADVLSLPWGSIGIADGIWTVRYTFDDGSTQDVSTTVSGGYATVPTNLNRRWLASAEKV